MSDDKSFIYKIRTDILELLSENKQPTMLYLGGNELHALMLEGKHCNSFSSAQDAESFLGIKITPVNKNSHFDIAFISGNNHYKPITLSETDCELINAREKTLKGINSALAVPREYLGENEI